MAPPAPAPYGDTPEPKVFGNVSPLDPEMFATIDEYASHLLARERGAKYSPVQVAQWIEDLADEAAARRAGAGPRSELARAAVDIRIQVGIGRFFAAKFRSAALYAVFTKSGSRRALEQALRLYRQGRDHWARMAGEARLVYAADITFGPLPHQRGHWVDRLPAIDADIAAMERALASAAPGAPERPDVRAAIDETLGRPQRQEAACRHTAPAGFVRGAALELELTVPTQARASSVRVHYRHVNQAERYQVADMRRHAGTYRATVPAAYTESPFPLQYYFEGGDGAGHAWLYPGFASDLTGQPYFSVRMGSDSTGQPSAGRV